MRLVQFIKDDRWLKADAANARARQNDARAEVRWRSAQRKAARQRAAGTMNCTHCRHSHINPATGQIDPDRCFAVTAGFFGSDAGVPCPCRDFDH